ncbi:serine hydrolase domain-containing protein [Nitratireductor thuwali]|uniref:Esterase EstB n=1 Tax=Nitratireductor thuwali TaxID=2267699 RepID=A0ABY5MN60_9HYPH|nr:Esterase EstB [Nitratireductor thuwali]
MKQASVHSAERPKTKGAGLARPLAAGLIAAALSGAPALADDLAQRVDAVIDRWVSAEKIVGVVAMIARDGEIVYRRAAGYADREAGIATKEDTIFRHASNTKAIVSAAALALVERGKLSLDDTVEEWLPYFTPRLADGSRPDITIRQLMTHTSGLSYAFLEPEGNAYRRERIPQGLDGARMTLEESLRRLASVPLFYVPGTEWRYSLSTDVLGAVVEKAAGMSLPEAVAHYVTGPLGMRSTSFLVADKARLAAAYRDGESRAVRMNEEEDELPLGVPASPGRALDPAAYPSGGGGMSGTAEDYLRFLEALRTGGAPILADESAALFAQHAIGDLRAWTEGEGWGFSLAAAVLLDPQAARTPQNAGTWQWGGVYGSHWFVDPADKLTVVVLTNTSVAGVIGEFPAELRDAIYAVRKGG